MKKLSFIYFILIASICHSQSKKWLVKSVSGEVSILDFTTSPPALGPLIPTFGAGGEEEINIMTDVSNNVLFTTAANSSNMIQIRDANLNFMPNSPIRGSYTSFESAICKVPCSSNQYYFFNYKGPIDHDSLFVSIIDMDLNGGLGDVAQKNIYIGSKFTEGMTISHQMRNGCRWLILPGYRNHYLTINAIKISHDGISAPIQLDSTLMANSIQGPKEIELSMDNSKLTLSTFSLGNTDPDIICYDFELENCSVSNKQIFSVSSNWVLGIEFSPDATKIYYQTNTSGTSTLGRVNLTTGANEIIDGFRGPYQSDPEIAGNGKIYVGWFSNNDYLSEIGDPNNPIVSNVQYVRDAIFINSSGCRSGLINFIDGEPPGTSIVPGSIDFSYAATSNCNEYVFMDSTCLGSWWEWDFGDGNFSNDEFPTHTFISNGIFDVILRTKICSDTLSTTKSIPINLTFSIESTPAACLDDNGTVTVTHNGGSGNFSYHWTPPNDTTLAHLTGLVAGGYSVIATDLVTGCSLSLNTIVQNSSGLSASITAHTDATCENNEDGSATIIGLGGQPPYMYLWPNGDTTSTTNHLAPGFYFGMVEDYNGCRAYASVAIDFEFLLPPLNLGPDTLACIGVNYIIDAGTAPGIVSYLWNDNSTSQTLNVTSNGNYSVLVTDVNGCESFDDISVSFVSCVQTSTENSQSEKPELIVFPNPANEFLSVSVKNINSVKITIGLLDLLGNQLLKSNEIISNNIIKSIDIKEFPAGIYLLKIVHDDKIFVKRFIKN
jgi:hypothetical protein